MCIPLFAPTAKKSLWHLVSSFVPRVSRGLSQPLLEGKSPAGLLPLSVLDWQKRYLAHKAVALAVRKAEDKQCGLEDLSLIELQSFHGLIEGDVYAILNPEGAMQARDHVGGTAPSQVRLQAAKAKKLLGV